MWQESPDEAWFCMACAWCNDNMFDEHCDYKDYCKEDMGLALVKCEPGSKRRKKNKYMAQFTLLESDGMYEGDQIKVHGTNLCMERKERSIYLQQCNSSVEKQRFLGFKSGGQAMELHPAPGVFMKNGNEIERCLTQHHHPRPGERVYKQECRLARASDTNLWSTY